MIRFLIEFQNFQPYPFFEMTELDGEKERLLRDIQEFRNTTEGHSELLKNARDYVDGMPDVINDEETRNLKKAIREYWESEQAFQRLIAELNSAMDRSMLVTESMRSKMRELRAVFTKLQEHHGQLELQFESIELVVPRHRILHHSREIAKYIGCINEVLISLLRFIPNNDRTSHLPILEKWAEEYGKFSKYRMILISNFSALRLPIEQEKQFEMLLHRLQQSMLPEWYSSFSSALCGGSKEDLQPYQSQLEVLNSELEAIANEITQLAHS